MADVTANYRFRGAWNEINARIAQRQNLLVIFVTVLGATVFASRGDEGELDWQILLVVPYASLVFSLMLAMHEAMIGNLKSHIVELEKIGNTSKTSTAIPSYHYVSAANHTWAKRLAGIRRTHDICCGIMLFGANYLAYAFGGSDIQLAEISEHERFAVIFAYVCFFGSMAIVVSMPWLRAAYGDLVVDESGPDENLAGVANLAKDFVYGFVFSLAWAFGIYAMAKWSLVGQAIDAISVLDPNLIWGELFALGLIIGAALFVQRVRARDKMTLEKQRQQGS